jgi:hypothetical protein
MRDDKRATQNSARGLRRVRALLPLAVKENCAARFAGDVCKTGRVKFYLDCPGS